MFLAGIVIGLAGGLLLGKKLFRHESHPVVSQAAPAAGAPTASTVQPEIHKKITALLERVRSDPKDRPSRVQLANITLDNSLFDLSAKYYEEALALGRNDPDVLTDLGIAYRNLKRFDDAIAAFEEAVRIDARHRNAWFNIAVVRFWDKKDAEGAGAALAKALEIDPSFAPGRELRAKIEAGVSGGV